MERNWPAPNLNDAATVAEALRAQPAIVEMFATVGGSVPFFQGDLRQLAALASSLDRIAHQLVMLLRAHRSLTRAQALKQAPGVDPAELDRAAGLLVVCGLARLSGAELTLVAALSRALAPALTSFEEGSAFIPSDRLAQALRRWGLPAGGGKAARQETLAEALRDPSRTSEMLAGLGPTATQAFKVILAACTGPDAPPGGRLDTYTLPEEWWPRDRYGTVAGPIDELCNAQLLGWDWSRSEVFPWAETVTAMYGSIFADWSVCPRPDTHPVPGTAVSAAELVATLRGLVLRCAANPPLGKLTGDRQPPVKIWRSAAKTLGVSPESAVLLAELAVELGLLVPVLGAGRGRGRNFSQDIHWQPEPVRFHAFEARSTAENWSALVAAHLRPELVPDEQTRVENLLVLALLAEVPPGEALAVGDLGRYGAYRHQLLNPTVIAARLVSLARLGVVEADTVNHKRPDNIGLSGEDTGDATVVWLSSAGRALLEGPGAVEKLLGQGSDRFVVQPDHSVIAPADLRVDLSHILDRIAQRRSQGGALVWRLDGTRLARYGAEVGIDALLHFLREGSSVALPGAIERFVQDSVAQAMPLHVLAAGCVLTAAQPSAVTEAARHKAAKLTVIAPGVAISPLSADRVRDVLAGKGELLAVLPLGVGGGVALAPALPTLSGDTAGTSPLAPLPLPPELMAPEWDAPHVALGGLLLVGGPLLIGDGAVAAVARQLLQPPMSKELDEKKPRMSQKRR